MVGIEGVQFDLVYGGHDITLREQLVQCLLCEITDANGSALRSDEALHHLPSLDKCWTLIFAEVFSLRIWSCRKRPVHQEHIDVLDVQVS